MPSAYKIARLGPLIAAMQGRAEGDFRNASRLDSSLRDVNCFASKVLVLDFSVQPLCPLFLGGVVLLGIHQPQRHRGHRG